MNTASMGGAPRFSFEFFPPNTPEGLDKLRAAWGQLLPLQPEYCSVTYGAGGSTQARSFGVVAELAAAGMEAAPHLSCVGSSRAGIREILHGFQAQGIRRIVALRGDLPSGMADPGAFRYASELVRFIRAETGQAFHLEVAAYPEVHPQARSAETDLDAFVQKVAAGADGAITQYFFTAEAYFDFVQRARARGVTVPIVPGIMPITNYTQLARFSDACGADIPRWVRKRLEALGDDRKAIVEFGFEVVLRLCERLLDGGVPALHFYTMNQAGPTRRLVEALGLAAGPVEGDEVGVALGEG